MKGKISILVKATKILTKKLTEQIEEAKAKEKAAKEVLLKHDLRAETFKMISKEVAVETKRTMTICCSSFLDNEQNSIEFIPRKKYNIN